jgi:hypothetical protein
MKYSMKNLTKNVMIALVALALTIANTSCKKDKSEDPVPMQPNTGSGTGTGTGSGTGTGTGTGTGSGSIANPIVTTDAKMEYYGSSFSYTVTASDADGIAKVEILEGATLINTYTTAPFTINMSNVSVGFHTYTVKVTDNKGGATEISKTVNVKYSAAELMTEMNGNTMLPTNSPNNMTPSAFKVNTSNSTVTLITNSTSNFMATGLANYACQYTTNNDEVTISFNNKNFTYRLSKNANGQYVFNSLGTGANDNGTLYLFRKQ